MITLGVLLSLAALASGQLARPYPRYYNPYQPPRPLDYRYDRPEIRDYRLDDQSYKPYSFSYTAPSDVGPGQSSRTESADGSGRVVGSYTMTNEEGHTRVVDYIADQDGFRATVQTDEPGTDSKSPAHVVMQSTGPFNYVGPHNYRRPYSPYVAPAVVPAAQPVLNAVDEAVGGAAGGAVEEPVNDPLARRLYRPPAYYNNRNYYQAGVYRNRGYVPPVAYRNPYTRPY